MVTRRGSAGVLGTLALALLLVLVAFSPALDGEFLWDDLPNLVNNPHWRRGWDGALWAFTHAHAGHYHPLTWLSFALDHALWDMNPRGYHLTNVALHAATAVLVYALIRELLALARARRTGPENADTPANESLAAAFGAALFALHPLRVESVAWITERRDVLSGALLTGAVLAYLAAARAPTPRARRARLALSVVFHALSLLSKAWAITLPAVLLVLDRFPLGRRLDRGVLLEKLPFAMLALAFALVAHRAQDAAGALAPLPWPERGIQAAYGLAYYLGATAYPHPLVPMHVLEPSLALATPAHAVSVAVVAALAAVAFARARAWPGVAAGLAAYAILLSPVLGFAQSGMQKVADRYTYLAAIPLSALAAGALAIAFAKGDGVRRGALALALAAVGVSGVLTYRQAGHWRGAILLWDHCLRYDPANYYALASRGTAYSEAGHVKDALADFDQALRLAPAYPRAHYCRGIALDKLGRGGDALLAFDRAVALDPRDERAHYARGKVLFDAKRPAEAAAAFDSALAIDPLFARALGGRGRARAFTGDVEGARADLERAVALDPALWTARAPLGVLLVRAGEAERGRRELERALADAPADKRGEIQALLK